MNVAGEGSSLDESTAAYKEALRLAPDLVEAWINLGQVSVDVSIRQHMSAYVSIRQHIRRH